jgi:hypothetical protein
VSSAAVTTAIEDNHTLAMAVQGAVTSPSCENHGDAIFLVEGLCRRTVADGGPAATALKRRRWGRRRTSTSSVTTTTSNWHDVSEHFITKHGRDAMLG